MTALWDVPEFGALVTIGFAKPQGGTGGYARYVAVCPASWAGGASARTIDQSPGAPLDPHSAEGGPLRRGADGAHLLRTAAWFHRACAQPVSRRSFWRWSIAIGRNPCGAQRP